MATDLIDYAEVLRREVRPPGTDPNELDDETLLGYLSDAFWEARLDGFLTGWTADLHGRVQGPTPDAEFPREQIALLVLYAGVRILRTQILNTSTTFRAVAGPVQYETQTSAGVLTRVLDELSAVKAQLRAAVRNGEATPTILVDGLTVRQLSPGSYGGYLTDLYAALPGG